MNKIHNETIYSLAEYRLLNALADYRERVMEFFAYGAEQTDIRDVKQRRENIDRMNGMDKVRSLAKELHDNRDKADKQKVVKLKTR